MTTAKTTKKAGTKKAAATSRGRKDAASLPNRVRFHREKAEVSPKELAASIGGSWTASTVRRIERGAKQATAEQMAQLAATLKVPAADLFPDALPSVPVEAQAKKPAPKRTTKATNVTDAVQEIPA